MIPYESTTYDRYRFYSEEMAVVLEIVPRITIFVNKSNLERAFL